MDIIASGTSDAVGDVLATIIAATYNDYPASGRSLLGLDINELTAITLTPDQWQIRVRALHVRYVRP